MVQDLRKRKTSRWGAFKIETMLVSALGLAAMMGIGCAPYAGVVSTADGRAHVFSSKTAYVCQKGPSEGARPVCAKVAEK